MRVEVRRITDPNLFRECAEVTTGKPCKMSWNKALCSMHSIIRAEKYLIKLYDIPLSVCQHLVRHIHSQPYVLSHRPDRGGEDFEEVCENLSGEIVASAGYGDIVGVARCAEEVKKLPTRFGRKSPTNMAIIANAEEIINISRVRLCAKASTETLKAWNIFVGELEKVDPDLANHCQPTCIFRGGICPESKSCGFNKTEMFDKQLNEYLKLFV